MRYMLRNARSESGSTPRPSSGPTQTVHQHLQTVAVWLAGNPSASGTGGSDGTVATGAVGLAFGAEVAGAGSILTLAAATAAFRHVTS
jgi:hypothetical protein